MLDRACARRLLDGDESVLPCVVQLLSLKLVTTLAGKERFVAHVSDSKHVVGAVFASEMSDLPRSGGAQRLALVEVRRFTTAAVKPTGARFCVIVRARLVSQGQAVIGSPTTLRRFGVAASSLPSVRPVLPRVVVPAMVPPRVVACGARAAGVRRPPLVGGSHFFGTHGRWLESRNKAKQETCDPVPRKRKKRVERRVCVGSKQRTMRAFFTLKRGA